MSARNAGRERAALTDEQIEAIAAADTYFGAVTAEDLEAAVAVSGDGRVKVPVSIRLDQEVLDFYRAQGPGYQTRINNDLLGLVRERTSARRRPLVFRRAVTRTLRGVSMTGR